MYNNLRNMFNSTPAEAKMEYEFPDGSTMEAPDFKDFGGGQWEYENGNPWGITTVSKEKFESARGVHENEEYR